MGQTQTDLEVRAFDRGVRALKSTALERGWRKGARHRRRLDIHEQARVLFYLAHRFRILTPLRALLVGGGL